MDSCLFVTSKALKPGRAISMRVTTVVVFVWIDWLEQGLGTSTLTILLCICLASRRPAMVQKDTTISLLPSSAVSGSSGCLSCHGSKSGKAGLDLNRSFLRIGSSLESFPSCFLCLQECCDKKRILFFYLVHVS